MERKLILVMGKNKTLFINAKVWQPDGSFVDAFGLDANRFDFTGSNEEAIRIKSNYDKVVDLNGRLVMPGLIDGHLHLCHGSLTLRSFDAGKINTLDELKSKIIKFDTENSDAEWIIGNNINLNVVLKEAISQEGNIVDTIYSAKPLYIANYDFHSAICNTKALVKSGLLSNMKNFSDSEVILDKKGVPTGIVKENALDYMRDNLPSPSVLKKADAANGFIRMLHSFGITSVSDITLIEDIEVYAKLFQDGKLKVRVNSYIPIEEYVNLHKHLTRSKEIDPHFYSIKGFKAYYDGSLGSETALFTRNYRGKSHNGYTTDTVTTGLLRRYADEIDRQGGQLIIHAIGDLAVKEVLDLYSALRDENGSHNSRHRIEHAQHINSNDLQRFKELGTIASVQPLHLKFDIGVVSDKLPDNLVYTTHNYKQLIDLGATIIFGTDFPIVEVNPFENIKMAITRNADGKKFTTENSIGLQNCIKSYTVNNAYANFNEKELGTIEPGKLADFVMMEDDLFLMEPENMGTARVWKTYVDGEEVYSADS